MDGATLHFKGSQGRYGVAVAMRPVTPDDNYLEVCFVWFDFIFVFGSILFLFVCVHAEFGSIFYFYLFACFRAEEPASFTKLPDESLNPKVTNHFSTPKTF